MASILQVEQIQGPTSGANANTITIPSGQTLDASNATLTGIQAPLVAGTDYLAPNGDGSNLTGISTSSFNEINTALQITLSTGTTTYTWSGHGIPANSWVSAICFISSTDSDQSDHLNVHVGPQTWTGTSWGDTYPGNAPPYGISIITNLGDSQGVAAGHYGAWDTLIFKTASNGNIYLSIAGTNAGAGIYLQTHGYWSI